MRRESNVNPKVAKPAVNKENSAVIPCGEYSGSIPIGVKMSLKRSIMILIVVKTHRSALFRSH